MLHSVRKKERVRDYKMYSLMKLLNVVVILTDCLTNSLSGRDSAASKSTTLSSNKPSIQPTHTEAQRLADRQRQSNTQRAPSHHSSEEWWDKNGRKEGSRLRLCRCSPRLCRSLTDIPWFESHEVCFGRLQNHVILLSSLPAETKEAFRRATDTWRLWDQIQGENNNKPEPSMLCLFLQQERHKHLWYFWETVMAFKKNTLKTLYYRYFLDCFTFPSSAKIQQVKTDFLCLYHHLK